MKNNFRKITASFLTVLITFCTSTVSNVVSAKIVNLTVKPTTQEYQIKKLNTQICKTINKYRKTKNAKPLKTRSNLTAMAKVRAKEIAKSFKHERPNGKSLLDLAKAKGAMNYSEFGEILAKVPYIKNADIADITVYGWRHSSGHNKIIKNRKYQYIGTSYCIKGDSVYVCSILTYA